MLSPAAAMSRALSLAWKGWGRVHPNPMVGALVIRDGEVIAEGWHAEFGLTHAEAMALEEAGELARGATLVVTLEPCRHQGKTPPCVDLVRAAGVSRVIVGAGDPNPVAQGGAAELAASGIRVELLDFETEVRRQNAAFFHGFRCPDRPWVALKLSTSIDGAIADRAGRSRWLSGPAARKYVHWLRAGFDAIGVGGRTARMDDPALTVRGDVMPRHPPRRVVFSRSGNLNGAEQLISGAGEVPVTVVAEHLGEGRKASFAGAGIEAITAPTLLAALRELRGLGVHSLLVEGGGLLASALVDQGLVDRFYWIQTPTWLGEGAIPAFPRLGSREVTDPRRWEVVERRALGEDTLLVLDRPA